MSGGGWDGQRATAAERDWLRVCIHGRRRSDTPVGLWIISLKPKREICAGVHRRALARDHQLELVVAGYLVSVDPLVLCPLSQELVRGAHGWGGEHGLGRQNIAIPER